VHLVSFCCAFGVRIGFYATGGFLPVSCLVVESSCVRRSRETAV